jgi:hypothetical protein
MERICEAEGIRLEELTGAGRRARVSRARAGVAYLWLERLGQGGPIAARALGLHPATIYEVARRGRQDAVYWESVLGEA